MAQRYSFIGSEQVTTFIPPNDTQEEQQVTAQAILSQVVYVARFIPELYKYPDEVARTLNALADGFNTYSNVPGVTELSTVQVISANDQLVDKVDVTVESTSGKSSTVFRTFYPTVDLFNQTLQVFEAEVEKWRHELDAVENA